MPAVIPKEVHAWLIGIELDEGISPDSVSLRIADALTSVGGASIEYIGEVPIVETVFGAYDEEDEVN